MSEHIHLWEAVNGNPDEKKYRCKCGAMMEIRIEEGVFMQHYYE